MDKALRAAQGDVEAALALLDSEGADALIQGVGRRDASDPEYQALIKGVRGVHQMLWSMALGNGMRRNKAVLKMGAQALTILLTLVHYAFALGVRAGQSAEKRPDRSTADLSGLEE